MKSYCTAQGSISNLLEQTMMEDNIRMCVCVYEIGSLCCTAEIAQHCKSTTILIKRI